MKQIILIVAFIGAVQTTWAQKSDWKEMHAFHVVMSTTFHPAENGNLQPTKDSAAVLVQRAKEWKASPIPKGYKKKETAEALTELVKQCEVVKAAIASKKTDEELKDLIGTAHDVFHRITEKCRE